MTTQKQYNKMIANALASYQKGEDRLNEAVALAIRHATLYRAPDMLANVHSALIANANTGLAKKFRTYVKEVSPWVWNDKTSNFSMRKKVDESWEDFADAWNERLGQSWRIDADKAADDSKPKPISREQGVKRALARATVHAQADREAAARLIVADMTGDELYNALVKAGKIDALLSYIADQQAKAA